MSVIWRKNLPMGASLNSSKLLSSLKFHRLNLRPYAIDVIFIALHRFTSTAFTGIQIDLRSQPWPIKKSA